MAGFEATRGQFLTPVAFAHNTKRAAKMLSIGAFSGVSLCPGINGFSIQSSWKSLVTLCDAALYITKLPKAEHDAEEWQTTMEGLLLVAEHDGPAMFARIGVMRPRIVTSSGCLV